MMRRTLSGKAKKGITIGHVRGVESALEEIESAAPAAAMFLAEARQLLERLDLAGIEQLVEEVRDAG